MIVSRPLIVLATVFLLAAAAGGLPAQTPEQKHFEDKIAPLLARHCLQCHGGNKEGGLDLRSRQSAVAGGDSGQAIVAGKSDQSPLWQYVEAGDMPKERPALAAEEKHLLRQWIDAGAAWGRGPIDPLAYSSSRRAGYDWWSLQPVRRPTPPDVSNEWIRGDIDRFVWAKLQANGLQPAPAADRRTLIRRAYFDLIGLPPEPAAVEQFLADDSPEAYDRLIEELLRSPHYGERWARHWLDVVRFGETQGFERNLIRENAWRYRDWVIGALNRDMPYDEFVRRQIAGDVLYPGDFDALMATGYHVCGTWDQVGHIEGSQSMQVAARWDHMEDLVATLGQSFLGLTINCARCHDHKFDPISQQDYYEIAALLGGVTQQKDERSGIEATKNKQLAAQYQQQLEASQQELSRLEQQIRREHGRAGAKQPVAGLELLYRFDRSSESAANEIDPAVARLQRGEKPRWSTAEPPRTFIQAVKKSGQWSLEVWLTPAKTQQTGPARIVTLSKDSGQRNFTLGHDGDRFDMRLRTTKTDQNGQPSLTSPGGTVTAERTHAVYTFDPEGHARLYVNGKQVAERAIGGDFGNWDESFRLGLGDEFTGDRRWEGQYHLVALYSRALAVEAVRRHFDTGSEGIGAGEPWSEVLARASSEQQRRHARWAAECEALRQQIAAVSFSGTAHVIIPRQPPVYRVLARGDPTKPQQIVAPRGLGALARAGLDDDFGLAPDAPEAQRRAKLAHWIANPDNPLTARVIVNRVWHYHFGRGLMDRPSDFGFNGGTPSHPELLDYLASEFMRGGWKLKDLHRLIMTSAAYRQQSQVVNERAREIDADNRLLWRFNMQRHEGEVVRDSALFVAGALNPQMGGPSYRDMKVSGGVMGSNAEFTNPTNAFGPDVNRRTIYRLWARSGNNPLLETLDCPDPSVMTPERSHTITPVQALSLMNNTVMEKCGEQFAERIEREAPGEVSRQIERAYWLALSRPPRGEELALAREFIEEHGLAHFCLVLLNTNEFLYVN